MKIKKLEWQTDLFRRWESFGVGCHYIISPKLVPGIYYHNNQYLPEYLPCCEDLESAKAACQKHFEEEVMEYLENDSLNSEVPNKILVQKTQNPL